ncbi:glycoside hydrolase family 108 protein [Novosphingobium sp. BL-52-GroH]|uniref:glycoside hydrolase family 108 protein n=1 Tax=Novosphingobium sp. BL-52-GroH TaxID=3349877 RepID=UPI00384F9DF3
MNAPMNPLILGMVNTTIGKEGAYSNHTSDPGGETIWGIIKTTAVANGWTGPMKAIPRDIAVRIYYTEYAVKPGFAAIAETPAVIGAELFDSGVNCGVGRPPIWFQEWLNAFNQHGRLYADIKEDGQIGPATLANFKAYLAKRGPEAEKVMLAALNADQAAHYKKIIRAKESNEDFTFGLMRTRVAA